MKQSTKISMLFARYFSIILLGLGNLYIFYEILIPLTAKTTNALLKIFTRTYLIGDIIYLPHAVIEIAPSCVAASAFYLLTILILSTANIKPEKRLAAISTAFSILFALNITRILILIPFINQSYFETLHWIFWHLVSIVFVLTTYFVTTKIHKIKSAPIYTDFKYIKSLIK
ncbi:pacearchaeosortase [archaeon]|nr:pacearchaeosortase [archaeon]